MFQDTPKYVVFKCFLSICEHVFTSMESLLIALTAVEHMAVGCHSVVRDVAWFHGGNAVQSSKEELTLENKLPLLNVILSEWHSSHQLK